MDEKSRYRPEYLEGLRLFNAGQFWDAHEELERVWLPLPKGAPERLFYQGLILLSAAFLHRGRAREQPQRYSNPALRCYRSGLRKLEGLPDRFLGLDVAALRTSARACFEPLASGGDVASLPAPPVLVVANEG